MLTFLEGGIDKNVWKAHKENKSDIFNRIIGVAKA